MALRLSTGGMEPGSPDEHKAELVEHLAELRARLIRSVVYCGLGMVVLYLFYKPIYTLIEHPIKSALPHAKFIFTNFTEAFFLKLQITAVGGLILAIPFVVMELWGFISPGLTQRERKAVRLIAPFSVL